MTNTVVTSTTNTISVVFNDDASITGIIKGVWNKSSINSIKLHTAHVSAETSDGQGRWIMTHTTSANMLKIDTVNGVEPSSLSDLYDKLIALLG